MLKQKLYSLILSEEDKAEIKDYYNTHHQSSIVPLTYSDFSEFSRTGKRIGYEKLYFDRRRRINSTFMMYVAYGDEYLNELYNLLWAICDEYTWALPAHIAVHADARHEIDLFAAETAMMLTELSYLLGDTLPQAVKKRIEHEVRDRVFNTFENRSFHWETAEHNWSAVCCGCIGMAYLYQSPDTLPLKRILSAMECYLSGYDDDGVCLEGLGYWSYGFGYYIFFAALLSERCGIDIINTEKVRAIAKFQQNMYLGQECVSCSDAPRTAALLTGLTGLLCELYPDDVFAPSSIKSVRDDSCGRWAYYIRSFLYLPKHGDGNSGELIYSSSQWYINKKNNYSFFIKGGNNNEPHNHNDIGSFIISDSDEQIICDIGCGEYTSDYFNPLTRYDYLCNSSLGHCVPIIDGNGQIHGGEYCCDKFECGNDRVLLSIGRAYDNNPGIIRKLRLEENSILLRDQFNFTDGSAHTITERFISCIKPVICEAETIIKNLHINKAAKVSEEIINDHSGNPMKVYLIDFEVCDNEFEVIFRKELP